LQPEITPALVKTHVLNANCQLQSARESAAYIKTVSHATKHSRSHDVYGSTR
jgi:hypothetical protein